MAFVHQWLQLCVLVPTTGAGGVDGVGVSCALHEPVSSSHARLRHCVLSILRLQGVCVCGGGGDKVVQLCLAYNTSGVRGGEFSPCCCRDDVVRACVCVCACVRACVCVCVCVRVPTQITQLQSKNVDEEERAVLFERTHARTAARAYQSIAQLRGMWVKTGQYLSSRADIMPEVRQRTPRLFDSCGCGGCGGAARH